MSFDLPLPPGLVEELCPEFTLLIIRQQAEWESFQRSVGLPATTSVDLSSGAIVGLVAWVGESVEPTWPLRITGVRVLSRTAWVDAEFAPGLYYPLRAAGYLEICYVPGAVRVGVVRINQRTFVINPAVPSDFLGRTLACGPE